MILRKWENIHIYVWLIKDLCWISGYKLLGIFMIVPTLSLAIWLSWKYRKDASELVHNIAICSWIIANSIWMIGEFYFEDSLRIYSKLLFAFGLGLVSLFYIYSGLKNYSKKAV